MTRRMEVVYANAAARSLVRSGWFGCRCWEIFPVAEGTCAARCPAVRAVTRADDIVYCEETIYAPDGSLVQLGIAVIPLGSPGSDEEQAVLLLRPKAVGTPRERFRWELLAWARRLSNLHG